jgi:hypothetical protein
MKNFYFYSVETTYGINSVISKLMTIVEITETGQFLFLIVIMLNPTHNAYFKFMTSSIFDLRRHHQFF